MTLAGWLRSVVEDVTEMSAAASAMFLGPDHAEGSIALVRNGFGEGPGEAGPAGTAVELCGRTEQRQVAARTGKNALALFLEQGAGEGTLRSGLTQDVEAGRTELLAPFGIAVLYLKTCSSAPAGH